SGIVVYRVGDDGQLTTLHELSGMPEGEEGLGYCKIAFTSDGRRLAVFETDSMDAIRQATECRSSLMMFCLETGRWLWQVPIYVTAADEEDPDTGLAWSAGFTVPEIHLTCSADGLLLCRRDGTLHHYDIETGRQLKQQRLPVDAPIRSVAWLLHHS